MKLGHVRQRKCHFPGNICFELFHSGFHPTFRRFEPQLSVFIFSVQNGVCRHLSEVQVRFNQNAQHCTPRYHNNLISMVLHSAATSYVAAAWSCVSYTYGQQLPRECHLFATHNLLVHDVGHITLHIHIVCAVTIVLRSAGTSSGFYL